MTRARFDAGASGKFRIGNITINRLGYGAMRITGPGIRIAHLEENVAAASLSLTPEEVAELEAATAAEGNQ